MKKAKKKVEPQWGGKRKGSGRPVTGNARVLIVGKVLQSTEAYLKKLRDEHGSLGKVLDFLAEFYEQKGK